MKLRPGSVLSALLIASVVSTQSFVGFAATPDPVTPAPAPTQSSMQVATIMLEDMAADAEKVMVKVNSSALNNIDAEKTAIAAKAIDDQIAATKKSDREVEALREEARKTAVLQARSAKEDLVAKIQGASIETLDRYAAAMKNNAGYASYSQEYAAAYTRTEKARIMTSVVAEDMDHVLAASLKRLNWLSGDGLRSDLQDLKNRVFTGKGDGDGKKIKRILMIAGAAVAFVGLATWGIASIKYGNAYKQQRNELESTYQARKQQLDDAFAKFKADLQGQRDNLAASQKAELDALVQKLSNQYNTESANLDATEKKFLSDNGYVWMQCNSYTQASSMICNNYDYKVFTGTSTCTVMCYKNVVQNKETLHAAPVCSSAYIPADCYSKAKYDAEYTAAYNQGYGEQYPKGNATGSAKGKADGQVKGQSDGNHDGDATGYKDGYNKGYNDEFNTAYNQGYKNRYNDGYEDGYNAGYTDGYNAGYNDGYYDGYDSVPQDTGTDAGTGITLSGNLFNSLGKSVAVVNSTPAVKPQFNTGYKDGYRDAQLTLSLRAN